MAQSIVVTFRDGSRREWNGNGYQRKSVKYGDGVVIVVDEYGTEIAFPLDTVQHVTSNPEPRGF